mmetsp:Transcript_17394/g.41925  ORF Transcript_17394/g.41925 Transcript_17394/m.41925 type:complete len:206 (+) Transcript_17394:194-811(+)
MLLAAKALGTPFNVLLWLRGGLLRLRLLRSICLHGACILHRTIFFQDARVLFDGTLSAEHLASTRGHTVLRQRTVAEKALLRVEICGFQEDPAHLLVQASLLLALDALLFLQASPLQSPGFLREPLVLLTLNAQFGGLLILQPLALRLGSNLRLFLPFLGKCLLLLLLLFALLLSNEIHSILVCYRLRLSESLGFHLCLLLWRHT